MKDIRITKVILLLVFIFAISVCPASAGDSTVTMTLTSGTTWDDDDYLTLSYSGSISGGNASSWSWDFGDGSTATGSSSETENSGIHTYSEAGTYTVSLTVESSDSIVSNSPVTDTVTISEPTLVASANITADSEALTVTYESTTDGAESCSWNFGDGNTSTEDSGTYTYSVAGTYTITLTATSPGGQTDTDDEEVELSGPLEESTVTIETLTASGTTWSDYATISYSASISGGTADSWEWDFDNDGTTDTTDTSSGTESSGTYTYSEAGTKTVSLTVTSSDSTVSNTPTDTVTITEPPLVASADISLDDEELSYDSTTTGAESWSWDFGDSSTDSTTDNGTHIYTEPGDYTVTLTAKSPAGNSSTYTEDIEINMLMAYFTADKTTGGAPLTVTFEDASSENPDTNDDIVQWSWDFDDGSTDVVNSDDSDVEHTFDDEGTYDVTLTVKDEEGDTDSYVLEITVDDDTAPTADFDLYSDDYEDSGAAPFTVRFIDESEPCEETNSTITEWYWEFINEEGTVVYYSWSQNPPGQTLSDAGKYTIKLTVTDEDGATDTEIKEDFIEVTLGLSATFSASPTSGNSPLTVSFTATDGKDNDYDIDTYYWIFGDGSVISTSTGSTSHTYTTTGTFDVKLKVTDEMSNTYTYTREDYITVNEKSQATAAPTQASTPAPEQTSVAAADVSAGTKIFGIPGTEFFRGEMSRFYEFYEEYLSLLTSTLGMS